MYIIDIISYGKIKQTLLSAKTGFNDGSNKGTDSVIHVLIT